MIASHFNGLDAELLLLMSLAFHSESLGQLVLTMSNWWVETNWVGLGSDSVVLESIGFKGILKSRFLRGYLSVVVSGQDHRD